MESVDDLLLESIATSVFVRGRRQTKSLSFVEGVADTHGRALWVEIVVAVPVPKKSGIGDNGPRLYRADQHRRCQPLDRHLHFDED